MPCAAHWIVNAGGTPWELIGLAEAWRLIQTGFCLAIGASVILGGVVAAATGRGGQPAVPEDLEPPHCSRCCPTLDDDDLVDA